METLLVPNIFYFLAIPSGVLLSRVLSFYDSYNTKHAHISTKGALWVLISSLLALLIFSSFTERVNLNLLNNIFISFALAFAFGFGFDKVLELCSKLLTPVKDDIGNPELEHLSQSELYHNKLTTENPRKIGEDKSPISTQSHQSKIVEKCFVIMPLGDTTKEHDSKYWDFFYKHVIIRAMEEEPITGPYNSWIHYKCEQPKAGRQNIMKDVVDKLMTSDLVVAVLTDRNANVWYELGIRHALQLPTVMIMEEQQEPPFDISQYGLVKYKKGIINKSRLLPLIHYLLFPLRKMKGKSYPIQENKDTSVYFDIHDREYRGQRGFREKILVEEYEKFKERIQFFSQDMQKRIDNPVMEFIDLPTVQLIARTKKIAVGETLEVRAELSKKDCSRIKGVKSYFAVSDSEKAKLKHSYSQETDNDGVIYVEIEGKSPGNTYVMVMAMVSEKQVFYKHTEIIVESKE